jgi:activator of HSP90 ATPase
MSKDLKQTLTFNCTPKEFFNLMTNSSTHARLTGKPANLSKKVGAKFRAYGRHLEGVNIEVKDNKELIQAWRAADWPKGVYSIVQFKITKSGNKTKVAFTHTGIPSKFHSKIKMGWKEHYWEPIKEYCSELEDSKYSRRAA